MIITEMTLRAFNACGSERDAFVSEFPNGLDISGVSPAERRRSKIMLPIVVSPGGCQYMLDVTCNCAYTFIGTPYQLTDKHRSFETIGHVTCLFAWQRGEMTPVSKDN